MNTTVEQERERCRQRAMSLGFHEYARRDDLYRQAARLCTALFWHPKRKQDPQRMEALLVKAEDRRERRGRYAWG